MTQTHDAISAPGWLDRMAQLAVRNGVHLPSLQPKDGRDLELLIASACLSFPADQLLDERAANEVLKTFLAGAGVMLDTDHVELRRWLVDTGFLRRSDYGTDYHRGTLPAWLADAAAALVGLIFAMVGMQLGVVSEAMFSVVVIMVVVTTLITPLVLMRLLARDPTT